MDANEIMDALKRYLEATGAFQSATLDIANLRAMRANALAFADMCDVRIETLIERGE